MPVLGAFCLGLLAATLAGAWWRARREGRALADRLAFHEAILERIPYAVYVKDGQGRFTSCNRAYELMVGVSRVALQGQTSRIRDFRGVSPKAFDGRGNYTLGLKEQLIFPEIEYDSVASIHGMDITIVTTAKTNDEGKALLKHLGMPFRG